jgi:hypothetical protein
MASDWPTLARLLECTQADTVERDAAVLDVLRWVVGWKPLLGRPPHNQAWQLARHRGLIERRGASHELTEMGWLVLEMYNSR